MFQRAFSIKKQIAIGPFAYEMIEPPMDISETAVDVAEFMNKALREKGPKSVFYVSATHCSSAPVSHESITGVSWKHALDSGAGEDMGYFRHSA